MRQEKGLSQTELAEKAGTVQAHIANIENGKRDIDIEMMIKLAKALGVKAYELLPEEEQPETLTPEEQAFIDLFRKTKETANKPASETKAG